MSVRKSHLMGKHHIKYYCDYYEFKAKETGEWNPQELIYEITFDKLNKGIPGGNDIKNQSNGYWQAPDRRGDRDGMDIDLRASASADRKSGDINNEEDGEEEEGFMLPPPPHLSGFPPPPPAIYNTMRETQLAIQRIQR